MIRVVTFAGHIKWVYGRDIAIPVVVFYSLWISIHPTGLQTLVNKQEVYGSLLFYFCLSALSCILDEKN